MPRPDTALRSGDGLLIVDVQRDFCRGGALTVPDGDAVVPVLNRWIEVAHALRLPIYASRDWHPRGHKSFQEAGGQWPAHCLQDSAGARFHPALTLPEDTVVVTKGTRFDRDQLSAFDGTGLDARLRQDGVRRIWVGGLAQEVCVLATVLDALRAGFEVHVIAEGTRPVDAARGSAAIDEMRTAGALWELGERR